MKHSLLFVSVIFYCMAAATGGPVELLQNGGFETVIQADGGSRSPFAGWRINNSGKLRVVSGAYAGERAAELTYEPHPWGYSMMYCMKNAVGVKTPGQPARKGAVYHFSMAAKGKGTVQAVLMMHRRKNLEFLGIVSSPPFILSEKYQTLHFDFKPAHEELYMMQLAVNVWKDSRAVVDNVSLTYDPEVNQLDDPGFVLPKVNKGRLQQARFGLPLLKAAPVVDGVVGENEYSQCLRIESLFPYGRSVLLPVENSYFAGSDGERLYLAARTRVSKDGLIDRSRKNSRNQEDTMEFLICPPSQKKVPVVYQAVFDLQGVTLSARHLNWRNQQEEKLDPTIWHCRSTVTKDQMWHFECSVPLAELGMTRRDLEKGLRIRTCRNWSNLSCGIWQSEIYAEDNGFFTDPSTMPVYVWSEEVPVVQHIGLKAEGDRPALTVSMRNLSEKKQNLRCHLYIRPQYSQYSEEQTDVVLAPGESRKLSLVSKAFGAETAFGSISISTPGGNIAYRREFNFQNTPPGEPFLLQGKNPVFFDYAYLPSDGCLASEVDFRMCQPAEDIPRVKSVTFQLRQKGEKRILETLTVPVVKRGVASLDRWKLQNALAEGDYVLTVKFNDSRLKEAEGVFSHRKFFWQDNKYGMTDGLLPGFTPIEIRGRRMDTVLRSHVFNELGLLESIVADGREVLASPMRLEYVLQNGRKGLARGRDFVWTRKSATRAEASFSWTIGRWKGRGSLVCDYDGQIAWRIIPPAGINLKSLKLVMPVRPSTARMMHALTDALRKHFAGYIPSGKGICWRGSQAHRKAIPAPFVPYLWVGNDIHGLCVTASNDRNWRVAPGAETQEMIRSDKDLSLVYHLVSRPGKIGENPGEICLFFQATPVKRRMKNWRLLTMGVSEPSGKEHNMAFLGQCRYWGAEVGFSDVFPKDRDMSVLKKFREARDTGRIDHEFFKKWIDSYDKMYATCTNSVEKDKMKKVYRRDLLGYPLPYLASVKPKNILFYTNPRGLRFDIPEGRVFLNEWSRERFPKRQWGYGANDSYLADPVKTYRDFSMWYFYEMSRYFLDIVYLDDVFLSPNYNLVQSQAFRDETGLIHPDCGFVNMREMVRRSSMMIHEQKRPVMTMVHMTNTGIMGIMSPAYTHFTWEYYASVKPFQERMTREMIRIVDSGIHSGTVPFGMLLTEKGTPEECKWAVRTGVGIALSHDMKLWSYSPLYQDLLVKLFAFGYGKDGVQVYNYWQENYPVNISGIDSSSIAIRNGKKMIVIVSDWKDGGNAEVSFAPRLNMPKNIKALDLENGRPLKTDQGKILFHLKKYDFKIFQVEPRL